MISTIAMSMIAMAPSVSTASSCCRGILGICDSSAMLATQTPRTLLLKKLYCNVYAALAA